MSMRNENGDPLALSKRSESNGVDALIDEAARRLVAGEPSSALRRGVRERIDRRRPALSFVPVLAGVAALLVVAVIVGRALLGPSDGPDRVRPTGERPTFERTEPAIASQGPEPTAIQPEPGAPRQLRRVAAVPLPLPEEEPLIPPITIEPLATAQIAVDESSGVMPIEIEPLQIEPLLGQ